MIINQVNLAGIYQAFSTIFQEAFAGVTPMWPQIAMEAPSSTDQETYDWLGDFPQMREWVGERSIKDLSAFTYAIRNKNYEGTLSADRNKIEDDKIGVYRPMLQGLGAAAAQHPDVLIFALLKAGGATLCYDGQYFFDTDHPENGLSVANHGGGAGTEWYLFDVSRPIKPLIFQRRSPARLVALDREQDERAFMARMFIYGADYRGNAGFGFWQMAYASKQTLNAANYAIARAAIMSRVGDTGIPLGLAPNLLVVPPTLEADGKAVVETQFDAAGASNVWFNSARLLVVPWLA